MALVPDGKTEWQGLGSLGGERGAVGATPAKTMFNFFSSGNQPNSSGPGGYERGKERRKSRAHMLFFFFWLHHTSSLTRDGTRTHPLHWELRVITTGQSGKSHMFLFLLLGLEKGSPGSVEPSRWMWGRQGSWNMPGDTSKQKKPLRWLHPKGLQGKMQKMRWEEERGKSLSPVMSRTPSSTQ